MITIYGNTCQNARIAEISLFVGRLRAAVPEVEIWSDFERYLSRHNVPSGLNAVETPSPDSNMVITLGGDGTLLQGAAWCGKRRIPLLGVNTGHLGFLTAYTLGESHLLLPDMEHGNLVTEQRILLEVSSVDPVNTPLPDSLWPFALNDIALLKADTSSMISVRTFTNSRFLTDYRADGLVISTPTGSTGYNLSAGGPVVDPSVKCLVLTPIAPHTLSIRPLVVDASTRIALDVFSRDGMYRIALDGRSFTMPASAGIIVKAASDPLPLVRRAYIDFPQTLRTKLHWGADTL